MKSRIPRKQKKQFKKTQPIIIVCYINVGNMPDYDMKRYMEKIARMIKPTKKMSKEIIHYITPVRDQETRIECINPVQIEKGLYNKVLEQLEENKRTLDKLLKDNEEKK